LHQFADARSTLAKVVSKNPHNLQAWLTLASLDRLSANYASARFSCERIKAADEQGLARVYGDICLADIDCHRAGSADQFRSLQTKLNRLRLRPEVLSWSVSLLAECEDRSGNFSKALEAYRSSLALQPENYNAISYADALIRQKSAEKAIQVLSSLPRSDSVLLRLAHAMRMQGNNQWKMLYSDVMQRFRESDARGDDSKLHARERAYSALWLGDDPKTAQEQAIVNIVSQKEVIDWLLLFEALEKNSEKVAVKRYAFLLQSTSLRDQRLSRWNAPQ
jgi:tetratricopeptide (TPR) repeat protein